MPLPASYRFNYLDYLSVKKEFQTNKANAAIEVH